MPQCLYQRESCFFGDRNKWPCCWPCGKTENFDPKKYIAKAAFNRLATTFFEAHNNTVALYLIVDWRLSFFFPLDMFVLAAAAVGVKGYMAFRVSCVSIFGLLSERRGRQPRKSLHWRFSIFFLDLLSINQFRSRIELPTPSKKKEKPRKEKNKQIKETEEKEMGPLRRIRFLILWYNNNITARVRRMNREQVLPASHRLVKLFETVLRAYI